MQKIKKSGIITFEDGLTKTVSFDKVEITDGLLVFKRDETVEIRSVDFYGPNLKYSTRSVIFNITNNFKTFDIITKTQEEEEDEQINNRDLKSDNWPHTMIGKVLPAQQLDYDIIEHGVSSILVNIYATGKSCIIWFDSNNIVTKVELER